MVPYTFSVFLFSFNLAQHCLFFLLLIGTSSKDVRRTLTGSETFVFFQECHETQISITNSLNRTLSPKIWASYCSAEYCPSRRMQKAHFRSTCFQLKTSLLKLTIKMLNNIMQNVVSPLLLLTWSPKPASRARRQISWYLVHARLHPL